MKKDEKSSNWPAPWKTAARSSSTDDNDKRRPPWMECQQQQQTNNPPGSSSNDIKVNIGESEPILLRTTILYVASS